MTQPHVESGSLSDPDGSIFLRKIGMDVSDEVPTLEDLKRAFLSLPDWERADEILDMIVQHYPEALRYSLDYFRGHLFMRDKDQDEGSSFVTSEVKIELNRLILKQRELGAVSLRSNL